MILTVGNSTSQLQGLTLEQYRALRQKLSYKVNAQASYFSQDHTGGIRYLLTKDGSFPTGLLYVAAAWLKASKLGYQLDDRRKLPTAQPGALKAKWHHVPYPVQTAVAQACKAHHRGLVVSPTGTGKSHMIALTIAEMGLRTLCVVPSLELKRQLTATLTAVFGRTSVGGLGKPIAVENIQALSVKDKYPYDVLILDEYHHTAAKTYRTLNQKAWGGIYHRFGFTASPFRADEEERLLMESILSKVIYRVGYADAVQQGFIVPMEAYVLPVPPKEVDSHHWQTVYKALVVNNLPRNALIASTLTNLASAGRSTLCLVKEVAHGEELSRLTGIPFAHGQAEDCESLIKDFSSGEFSALIATTGVCGEGVDTRAAEYVVIAGLGRSKPAFMQQVGRGFRRFEGKESCKVILFQDKSHKFCLTHYRAQVTVLRDEYGIAVTKLE